MIKMCEYDKANLVLVGIDECGDEFYADWWSVCGDVDDDLMELWKDTKIAKAHERWPEARGFYFEDRREWYRSFVGGWYL